MKGLLLILCLMAASAVATPSFAAAHRGPRAHPACWTCTTVVKVARSLDVTEDGVDRVLDSVCDHVFPWLQAKCADVVDRFSEDLEAVADLSLAPEEVCAAACGESDEEEVREDLMVPLVPAMEESGEQPEDSGLGCTICTLIVGYAEDKLESNATIGKITEFLNTTVCGLLPSFLRPECAALVDEYLPELAEKIQQGYPAKVICQDIGICPKSSATQVKPELMKAMVKPGLMKAMVKPALLMDLQPAKTQANGLECTICKLIIGYVEDKLASNSTVQEVEKFLQNDVCGLLPSFLAPECDSLVQEYAPELAQKIADKYPSGKICASVHLCSSSSSLAVNNKKLIQEMKEKSKKDDPLICSICTLVVGYAEDDLAKNSTVQSIEAELNKVCSKLPSFLQTGCLGLVSKYGPDLAPYILKHDPPATVCEDVNLCPKNNTADSLLKDLVAPIAAMNVRPELMKPLVKPHLLTALVKPQLMMKLQPANKVEPDSGACDLCEIIVGYLEDKLETNATLAKIETFLNTTVCDLLPSFLRVECAAIVDQYAPAIAQKFKNKETPGQICKEVGLCKNSSAVTPLTELVPAVRPELMIPLTKTSTFVELVPTIEEMDVRPELMHELEPAAKAEAGGAVECTICRLIVNAALEFIGNGKTVTQIENWFNTTACHILPKIFRGPCDDLVDHYLPQLIAGLENKDNSTVLCDKIHLC